MIAIVLLAALLVGGLGLAIYKRAEIADILSRGSEVLGEGASAVGKLQVAKTLAALLGQRSPGERTAGELANDKQRYAARPQQRALGKIRPALPVPFVKALTTPIPEIVPDVVPFASLASPLIPSVFSGLPFVSTPGVFIGPGGSGGPGPGGGGPGPGPGPGPGVEVPPVVPAIPEPATWLTMILGFFIVARALRTRRPAKAPTAAFPA